MRNIAGHFTPYVWKSYENHMISIWAQRAHDLQHMHNVCSLSVHSLCNLRAWACLVTAPAALQSSSSCTFHDHRCYLPWGMVEPTSGVSCKWGSDVLAERVGHLLVVYGVLQLGCANLRTLRHCFLKIHVDLAVSWSASAHVHLQHGAAYCIVIYLHVYVHLSGVAPAAQNMSNIKVMR